MRVCFAIPGFQRLGAQRVAIWIAKSLPRERYEVSFLVHTAEGEMRDQLPSEIPVHSVDAQCLRLPRGMCISRPLGYLRCLRLIRPQVVVGVVQYPTLAVASIASRLDPRPALIACEHSFVSKNIVDPEAYPAVFRQVYRRVFPLVYNRCCAAVVVTADEGRVDLIDNWGIKPDRVRVIPNPLDLEALRSAANKPLEDAWLESAPLRDGNSERVPTILAAGRLAFQKRFDILIEAFALLRESMNARLMILGAGQWRERLQELLIKRNLLGAVRIEDRSPPWRQMARADLFVLSSEWEGFPMVLGEAMALGCPIVSVRCPSGPAEMLDEGRAGWLAPQHDPAALARTMMQALRDVDGARERSAYAVRKAESYAMQTVARQYADLFERVIS